MSRWSVFLRSQRTKLVAEVTCCIQIIGVIRRFGRFLMTVKLFQKMYVERKRKFGGGYFAKG